MTSGQQKAYKSPVFAVFPFEEPEIFHYPAPDYTNCDQTFMDAIKQLQEDQARGISVKKRAKKAPKKSTKKSAKKDR